MIKPYEDKLWDIYIYAPQQTVYSACFATALYIMKSLVFIFGLLAATVQVFNLKNKNK
jgi:hypothetical protein